MAVSGEALAGMNARADRTDLETVFHAQYARLARVIARVICDPARAEELLVAALAPDFTRSGASGESIALSSFRGKVVLLNFWATWCRPCAVEMPWFIEFQHTYANQGFTVLGVSLDEDGWKSVGPFLKQMHVDYPVVISDDDLAGSYGDVSALPTTLIIDRSGRIASTHVGLVEKGEYEKAIQAALAQK